MKIELINGQDQQAKIRKTEIQKKTESGAIPGETRQASDTVSLSTASKDMQVATAAVATAPDIRAEAVARYRQAIEQGRYEIHPEKIAEKILGSVINHIA
jgi:negative regulator of flagellin synthesis FlgM